jgi:hypothetical protein
MMLLRCDGTYPYPDRTFCWLSGLSAWVQGEIQEDIGQLYQAIQCFHAGAGATVTFGTAIAFVDLRVAVLESFETVLQARLQTTD